MIPAINKEVERGSAIKQTDFNIQKSLILMILALPTLFFIEGCIPYYIPAGEHGYKDQEAVTEDIVKQLEPGTTAKNEVILLLGNLDRIRGNLYCYYWRRTEGYWGVLWYGTPDYGESGRIENLHAFCLEFMPDDKLKRFKHFESGEAEPFRAFEGVYQQIEDWENEED